MLPRQLSKFFSGSARARGAQYCFDGLVSKVLATDSSISAMVEGSFPYAIQINWKPKSQELNVYCSCPHFAEGFYCKHLWATLMECGNKDCLPAFINTANNLQLVRVKTKKEERVPSVEKEILPPTRQRFVSWMHQIDRIALDSQKPQRSPWNPTNQNNLSEDSEIWYELHLDSPLVKRPVIRFHSRSRNSQGIPGKLKNLSLNEEDINLLPEADRDLVVLLVGNRPQTDHTSYEVYEPRYSGSTISQHQQAHTIERLCATKRFGYTLALLKTATEVEPLEWDAGKPWELSLSFESVESKGWRLHVNLKREKEERSITDPIAYIESGLILFKNTIARLANPEMLPWVSQLKRGDGLFVQKNDAEEFAKRVAEMKPFPKIENSGRFPFTFVEGNPVPKISFSANTGGKRSEDIEGTLSFIYENPDVKNKKKLIFSSNFEKESKARRELAALGLKHSKVFYGENEFEVPQKRFVFVVQELLRLGWKVDSEKFPVRYFGEFKLEVSSGIDWFDLKVLEGDERQESVLPEILEAMKRGESFVELGDGSKAILPEEWLKRFGTIARFGSIQNGQLRFQSNQAHLLNMLLETQDSLVNRDAAFKRLASKLSSDHKISPKKEPTGFKGKLRAYQKKGLGWLSYLEEMGLSGCLADDMGLGKTIQVLALLKSKQAKLPSLIVAPKSLVFNWISESKKFTPSLKVVEYAGGNRKQVLSQMLEADLVVTTYGAIRSDILELSKVKFHYVILDESQAIKNSTSQISKAVRLLQGDHRLVLSGTPIENHMGELWSQFEFLMPGMLGNEAAFKGISQAEASDKAISALGKALEPFILRRTKEQVLKELPPKTEQILYCDFEPEEKKKYDDLREYYRQNLNDHVGKFGINRSQIQILEALLRLRQASCDFRLLDKEKKLDPGTKIRTLMESLTEILESGHKALIFSQFTSFLSLVKTHLDKEKIQYEYLDGATKDRKERVQHFQEDKNCSLFLLSLKAGGVGLNLTAADYVFVLDPWWNPAVEAQAIDRAHRIGQKHPVMVYRLIVRNTIEEKVLELQNKKKALTQSILSSDKSMLRAITAADLQLLFTE